MKYNGNYVTTSRAPLALRLAIVLTMIAAVAALLHFSHYQPKQTFLSCDRPCHHLDWPMICRVKLTLEAYQSLSKSCGDCPANRTACSSRHCVSADGQKKGILVANRQMPGPSIQVCENDILVVDVVNRLPGRAVSVHWRGQTQMETPCMDGAPLVTQCPIPSYTIFQYKFRAVAPGTHLWHAHGGDNVAHGLSGSLIVRQADIREPQRALYDVDDPKHVILVSEWKHGSFEDTGDEPSGSKDTLLVNGRGRQPGGKLVPLSTFVVKPGRRHRFRVAHAGGAGTCPVNLSVEGHSILVISLDGNPVNPQQVTSITLAKGERVDFVLKANHAIRSYWLNARTVDGCGSPSTKGAAVLRYNGAPDVEPALVVYNSNDSKTIEGQAARDVALTTDYSEGCDDRSKICLTDVHGLRKLSKALAEDATRVKMYLPVSYSLVKNSYPDEGEMTMRVSHVANATFTFPSSPLLTQRGDIAPEIICSTDGDSSVEITPRCRRDVDEGRVCECVHVRRIPVGSTVELILLDQGGSNDLVYHLHGYSFYVVGSRRFDRSVSMDEIRDMDSRGVLLTRNLVNPPRKDTVTVPKYGLVALRFEADNPGYWMLRDEHAPHWTRGLDVILQVGNHEEMIPAPEDFPKCGSYVGPDYFLI